MQMWVASPCCRCSSYARADLGSLPLPTHSFVKTLTGAHALAQQQHE